MNSNRKPNRLFKETSPYLKQHAYNPVDWYPWGEEALQTAKARDLPILLSVGYSACHWCHVMERECFESESISELMNKEFICIKVDREERPDIDLIYQNIAQVFTQGGGWPLTVFLTPDLKPFYGGTYFPPTDKYGRPGFPRLLESLSHHFRTNRAELEKNANELTDIIHKLESLNLADGGNPLDLDQIGNSILSAMDETYGGFRGAPKFPNVPILDFMLKFALVRKNESAAKALYFALEKMARGGIYDQVGGGFHRYSVDESWSVPHFEKMLYDQALLLEIYAQALLAAPLMPHSPSDSQCVLFKKVLSETIVCLERDFFDSKSGLFNTAWDADSEGEEGKYFVFTPSDLNPLGDSKLSESARAWFGINDYGNFEHGSTVLFLTDVGLEQYCDSPESFKKVQEKLWALREKRERPALDDKKITSLNALAASGLYWAAHALAHDPKCKVASTSARGMANRVLSVLENIPLEDLPATQSAIQPGGPLTSKWSAYLDDYSFLAKALFDRARLEFSLESQDLKASYKKVDEVLDYLFKKFWDEKAGGFFFSQASDLGPFSKSKTISDNAVPSGAGVAMEVALLRERAGAEAAFQVFERAIGPGKSDPLSSVGLLGLKYLLLMQGGIKVGDPSWIMSRWMTLGPADQICGRGVCKPNPQSKDSAIAEFRSFFSLP